jgi:hypothetical protein
LHADEGNKNFKSLNPKSVGAWNMDAEFDLQVLPRLNEFKAVMPRTKFSILDTTNNTLTRFDKADESWVEDARACLSLAWREKFNIYHFKSIKENFDKGLSVCIVDGIDKPSVRIRDERVFLAFVDNVCNGSLVAEQNIIYPNVRVEYFYWAETTAPMIAKQVHIIKRWLEANPALIKFWREPAMWDVETRYINLETANTLLRDVIYTTWDHDWFQVLKGQNGFAGSWLNKEFDIWAKRLLYGTKNYQIWQKGMEYVVDNAGSYVKLVNDRKDALQSFSKEFYVGKLDTKLNTA